jgi:beta-phosphoglucomutase
MTTWSLMKRIEACIFDLDGVLVDTARLHYLAWKRLANNLGFDLSPDDNERLKGIPRMASLEIVLSLGGLDLGEAEKAALAERKNSWYRESLASLSEADLLPGAGPFLGACRAGGARIALASASASAKDVLRSTGIAGFFDAIVDGTDGPEPKPSPDIFLRAARKLGADSSASVVFEDAAAGIAGAKAAGMLAVGIGSPALLGAADLVMPGFAGVDAAALLAELARRPGR